MNRKILYIIFTALAILVLVALLWWWFLRREAESIQTTGTFGTAQNAPGQGSGAPGGAQGTTNIGTAIPQTSAEAQQNVAQTGTNIQLGAQGGTPATTQEGQIIQGSPVGQPAQGSGSGPIAISGTPNIGGGGGYGGSYIPETIVGTIGVPGVVWLYQDPGATIIPYTPGVFIPNTILSETIPYIGAPTTTSVAVYNPTTGGAVTAQTAGAAPGSVFNPTAINQISGSSPTGNGGITGGTGGYNPYGQQITGSGGGAGGAIALAAGIGVVSCAVVPGMQALAQALGLAQGTPGFAGAKALEIGSIAISVSTVSVGTSAHVQAGAAQTAGNQLGQQTVDQFMGCLVRNIAKMMLQQITNSVVNWINSGFQGSPAFVQNPGQYLRQTADAAAGSYIQSSALSFLCSPFQLQVRIAIAQSYANRNAMSCTLTQVSRNITNFMRGSFSTAGGWPAFLSFTTMPTNNPYGAFLYGSIGLSGAVNTAQNRVQTDLLQGQGFLSFQKKDPASCKTQTVASNEPGMRSTPLPGPSGEAWFEVCKWNNTTPGTIIKEALVGTENSTLNSLNLAKSFDEIISALINQLMVRTLQGGLSNLSGAGGYASNFYTPEQLQAQNQGQLLLTQMQSDTAIAAQYGAVQQGSIEDIQNAQSQLNELYNCWSELAAASSTAPAASQAAARAALASTSIASLEASVNAYNNRITLANKAIVFLEQVQTKVLSSLSTGDLSEATSQYNAARASGSIPTQNDITGAQQNRATLQTQMGTRNQQTQAELTQCRSVNLDAE